MLPTSRHPGNAGGFRRQANTHIIVGDDRLYSFAEKGFI